MAEWKSTVHVVTEETVNPTRVDRGPSDAIQVVQIEIGGRVRGRLTKWPIRSLDDRDVDGPLPPPPIWTATISHEGFSSDTSETIPGYFETQQMALDALVVALATRPERVVEIQAPRLGAEAFRAAFDAVLSPAVRGYTVQEYHEVLNQCCTVAGGVV